MAVGREPIGRSMQKRVTLPLVLIGAGLSIAGCTYEFVYPPCLLIDVATITVIVVMFVWAFWTDTTKRLGATLAAWGQLVFSCAIGVSGVVAIDHHYSRVMPSIPYELFSSCTHSRSFSAVCPVCTSEALIFVGSGNVWPDVRRRSKSAQGIDKYWIDMSSKHASDQIFSLFDYGRTDPDQRTSFVAMSSAGTAPLLDLVDHATRDQTIIKDNYWLAIHISARPVFVMYRELDNSRFHIHDTPPSWAKTTFSHYLMISDFQRALLSYDSEPRKPNWFYSTEPGAGTRLNVQRASPDFKWPSWGVPSPGHLDELGTVGPMLSVDSAIPITDTEFRPDPGTGTTTVLDDTQQCKKLARHAISTAALCTKEVDGRCTNTVSADHVVLIKIIRAAGHFVFANKSECALAAEFFPESQRIDARCLFFESVDDHHIVNMNADVVDTTPAPTLRCEYL